MQCSCGKANVPNVNFCVSCGKKIIIEQEVDHQTIIRRISVFFFILVGYIALINFLPLEGNSATQFILDGVFALIVLIFFLMNFKRTVSLFSFKKLKIIPILVIIFSAFTLALLVSLFAHKLNQELFNTSQGKYMELFSDSPSPLLFSIISVGVFPAIFEEMAFRGILFDDLSSLTGRFSVILVTAILFTILHFSILSVLWIFPIGVVFGFLRDRYNTLLYGIIGHFFYNSFVVLLQQFLF